jgi:hypothetical protein
MFVKMSVLNPILANNVAFLSVLYFERNETKNKGAP